MTDVPRQICGLLRHTTQGCGDADETETREDDAAHRQLASTGDGNHLGCETEDRHGIHERCRLGEAEADPVIDGLIAAEANAAVAIVDVGEDQCTDDCR